MIVRKIELSDLETRVSWMNNPRIYSSMHYDVPIMMDNTIRWYEKNLQNACRCDLTILENDRIVAFGGITSIDRTVGKAETYIFADPLHLSKGIGTRAQRLICDYGFRTLGLNKLYIFTNEDNAQSIKAHEKCGFVLEGRLRQEYVSADGEKRDRLYMGLLREEWLKMDRK